MWKPVILTAVLSCAVTSACFLVGMKLMSPGSVTPPSGTATNTDRLLPPHVPDATGTDIRGEQVLLSGGRDKLDVTESHQGRLVNIQVDRVTDDINQYEKYLSVRYLKRADGSVREHSISVGGVGYIDLDGDGNFDRRGIGSRPHIWLNDRWVEVDSSMDASTTAVNRAKNEKYEFANGKWTIAGKWSVSSGP